MIKWLCVIMGLEPEKIDTKSNYIYPFCLSIILTLLLSIIGFFYAIYNTTESLFLGILLSIFFSLLIINIYRLVFSISEGELNKYDKFIDISRFILKRGFLIVLLGLFVSKSVEVYLFKNQLDYFVDNYKKELKSDFNYTIEIGQKNDVEIINSDFKNKIADDILFDRSSIEKNKLYEIQRDSLLSEIQSIADSRNLIIDSKINDSSFFITKIRLLSNNIPISWLITIIIILIFLSPFYFFLTTPLFTFYDLKCSNLSKSIINDEYVSFKNKYSSLILKKTGKKINFQENYIDPPFNKIKKKSSFKTLNKGSIIEWLKKFETI